VASTLTTTPPRRHAKTDTLKGVGAVGRSQYFLRGTRFTEFYEKHVLFHCRLLHIFYVNAWKMETVQLASSRLNCYLKRNRFHARISLKRS